MGTYSPLVSHLVDVHCHPTDSPITTEMMVALPLRICAMATRVEDQDLVRDLAERWPDKVIPGFGFHPWFSHKIYLKDGPPPSRLEHYASLFLPDVDPEEAMKNSDFSALFPCLPDPIPLSAVLKSIRANLEAFPYAMLGEVGLDRIFRIPFPEPELSSTESPPRTSTNKRLSPFTVPFAHQLTILETQIALAVELGRNISLHSVKAQQATVDLIKNCSTRYGPAWDRVSLDFHSCGLSAETWAGIEKAHNNVYLSLSTAINGRSRAHEALVRACDPTRILVESDYPDVTYCAPNSWDMLLIIARLKDWWVEENEDDVARDGVGRDGKGKGAVRRIKENWEAFVRGNHVRTRPRQSGKIRKHNNFPHAEEDWVGDGDEVILAQT